MAALLQLLEQVAEAAGNHAAGCGAAEHSSERAFEDVTKTAAAARSTAKTAGHATAGGRRRWCGRRRCARLARGEMFEGLPGKQAEDRHGHGRHSAAGLGARSAGAAGTLLHAIDDVE